MNSPINFQPVADGWFHIAPHGTFPHPTGAMQVIDAEACEAMLRTFNEEARQPNFPGLLVDFDHSSHDPAQPTTAAGWIGGLDHRDDGLYAQIRWSDLGLQALTGGRYRLASPVWNRGDCDQWTASTLPEGKEVVHLRPRRLDRLALTNDPNLPGLAPLSNRVALSDRHSELVEESVSLQADSSTPSRASLLAGNTRGFDFVRNDSIEKHQHSTSVGGSFDSAQDRRRPPLQGTDSVARRSTATTTNSVAEPATATQSTMNLRNEILQQLKLPGTATDAEITEAMRRQVDELNTLRNRCQRLQEAQTESDLERFADVITNRDVVRTQLLANRENTLALLNALRQPEPPAPLHQPHVHRPHLHLLSPVATEPDSATARRIANRARQLQSQLKIGHHAAFRLAEGETFEPEAA